MTRHTDACVGVERSIEQLLVLKTYVATVV
jgi:hypothetical protein